jgi:eukaryotic-like serine/threonine-protein kinase
MPPKLIGPYRVVDTLGSGGAGTVYRAVDRRTNDTVALKLLSVGPALDPRAARRLAREFEALADLSHPNVVRVFETGVHQGYPYLTMELIEGLTLRHYLSLSGPGLLSQSSSSGPRRTALWELDDASDTDTGEEEEDREEVRSTGAFDLAAFAEEPPSEVESHATALPGAATGAGVDSASLGAFAGALEEDDTEQALSGGVLALPGNQTPGPAVPPALTDVSILNNPERMGRLKDALVQVCEALAYIHAHGLVHRDLKPSNIMVDEDRQVRLMDFGLAKFLADDDRLTAHGRHVGTYRYMAPEQILGEPLDGRADLYSLGVVLYELLAGRPPFDGRNPHELWQRVLETEPVPVMNLNTRADLQLARVAHRLLRKEPEQRYQTAEEVYEALVE